MEKMLAMVVNSETDAYEVLRTLKKLDEEDSITVYSEAVIEKTAQGAILEKQHDYEFPIRAVSGTAIGAFIGLLGAGPIGMVGAAALGGVVGGLAGSIGDLYRAEVGAEFFDQVNTALKPGKLAVIADVDEEWVTPVDAHMEALGVPVMRTAKREFEADQRASEVARLRAELDQTKAELAQAHVDRKAKLQAKADGLNTQLQAQLNQAKQRLEQIKSETEAKVRALQNKAKTARADVKANLEAQIKEIRQDYDEKDAKLRRLLAGQLRAAAARIEPEPSQTARR